MMFYYYLFLAFMLAVIIYTTLYAGIYGAPSIPTPKKAVLEMIKAMEIKKGGIYYDLGSGGGRILKEIAQRSALAIGFEYAPLTYLLSKLIFLFNRDKKIKIFWKNFYLVNLKNVSGIFCFLTPSAMVRLEPKFEKELKLGTKVVSYAFKLPDRKPKRIIKVKNYAPIYVYKY